MIAEAVVPAGSVLWRFGMPLTATGLLQNLSVCPRQTTEVIGHKDSHQKRGGRGAAAHAQRNLIVELEMDMRSEDAGVGQDVHIGGENQVVFEPRTLFGVAASRGDVELLGGS